MFDFIHQCQTDSFYQLLLAQAQNLSAFVNEIQLKINSVCVREKCLSCEGWKE